MTNSMPSPSALHIIDTGGPGGAETMFSHLATRMDGRPLRTVAVVPREGWLSSRLLAQGVSPEIVGASGSFNLGYLVSLARIARAQNVRLIHAHLLGSSVYAAMLGLALRLPVIGVFHGPNDLRAPGRFAGAKRWLLRHGCSRLVAVSESTRASLDGFGIAANAVTLIPNGIDISSFDASRSTELRQEIGLAPGDILVGAVGNIRSPKAYDILIRAAALVVARKANVHFAVVGAGDEQQMRPLLQLRDDLGIGSRFHFLGFRGATKEIFGNFDVFVSSSRSEGLPLSFLEAMASGLCVVATESGGAQEVISPETTGLLVPIENPAALAAALERAADDPQLRARLANAGRERVIADYGLDAAVSRYEQLYTELLARPRAKA